MTTRDSDYHDNIELLTTPSQGERDLDGSTSAGSVVAGRDSDSSSYGKPSPKPVFDPMHLLVLAATIVCCLLACAVVTFDQIAWHLGPTPQLVLVGFFMSNMMYCLQSLMPTLLQMCEVRFGSSKIHNIDAIRVNSTIASQVDWWWRGTLGLLLALPLGLSAAYKFFQHGAVTLHIGSGDPLYNVMFGINPPPGLLPLGWNTGQLLMPNATMAFLTESTNQTSKTDIALNDLRNDYLLPTDIKAYGFNTLLLNDQTAALLDSPSPAWIDAVQNRIQQLDSIQIEADVLGTVSVASDLVDQHRSPSDPWWNRPNATDDQLNKLEGTIDLNAGSYFWFRLQVPQPFDYDDASPCFTSLYSDPASPLESAHMYNTTRRNCRGRWNVTKTSVYLIDGRCDASPSPASGGLLTARSQLVFTHNRGLALVEYFPALLAEVIAPFVNRTGSRWQVPTEAVAVATAYWSRVAASVGPSSPHWRGDDSFSFPGQFGDVVRPNATLSYTSRPEISWTKPAFRKAALLYVVICVLPVLVIAVLLAIALMYRVPIGRGFGLVAVLAGVERESLGLLRGAGFSGEVKEPMHLGVFVQEAEKNGSVRGTGKNGKMAREMAVRYEICKDKPGLPSRVKRDMELS